jgi:aconitate hydratase
VPPLSPDEARGVELIRGENIVPLPEFDALPDVLELPVLLRVGDNVSTDEIMPAGSKVLPYRSNVPKLSEFVFHARASEYAPRARERGNHAIVGGHNYGQGSSREHAALVPRYLGLRVVLAKSFARIHWQNLVNFGVLPLTFDDDSQFDELGDDAVLKIDQPAQQLRAGELITMKNVTNENCFAARHQLSQRQIEIVIAGGIIAHSKCRCDSTDAAERPSAPEVDYRRIVASAKK